MSDKVSVLRFMFKYLKRFFSKGRKVLPPSFVLAEWNDKYRFELSTFMKTDAGKSLLQVLSQDVLFTQVMACRPKGDMGFKVPLDAAERFAIAFGKETLLSKFVELYSYPEHAQDFQMDEQDLKEILHNRINGHQHQEVEL